MVPLHGHRATGLWLGDELAGPRFVLSRSEPEAAQTLEVRELIRRHSGGTLVLVTHQVNITALTGLFPDEGEMLILTPRGDGFVVAGRLKPSEVGAN